MFMVSGRDYTPAAKRAAWVLLALAAAAAAWIAMRGYLNPEFLIYLSGAFTC